MTALRTIYNFTALLSLFPTKNGGRKTPVYNHYRPSFSFGKTTHFSGEVLFSDKHEVQPGDTVMSVVKLLPSRYIPKNLKTGDPFTILEGGKIIGTGVIKEILLEDHIPVMQ